MLRFARRILFLVPGRACGHGLPVLRSVCVLDRLADKPITRFWDRFYKSGIVFVIAEGPPYLRHTLYEHIVRYSRIPPDRIEQFAFRYQAFPTFEQVDK